MLLVLGSLFVCLLAISCTVVYIVGYVVLLLMWPDVGLCFGLWGIVGLRLRFGVVCLIVWFLFGCGICWFWFTCY